MGSDGMPMSVWLQINPGGSVADVALVKRGGCLTEYRLLDDSLRRALELAEGEPLMRLGLWVLEQLREERGIDPFDIQDEAERLGVLVATKVPGSCADDLGCGCACDDVVPSDEERTCYRDSEAVAALKAKIGESGER